MRIKVEKWQDSWVLRIPETYAQSIGLKADSELELIFQEGKLMLEKLDSHPTLDELLAQITPESLHTEIPIGKLSS
jgi:antitoxin MazE